MNAFNKAVEELGINALYEVKQYINNVIQEELGISDVVDYGTDALCSEILEKLKSAVWEKTEDKGIKHTTLTFEFMFNEKPVNVSVECYSFNDAYTREAYKKKYPNEFFENARSAYGKTKLPLSQHPINLKSLVVSLLRVSGQVDIERLRYSVRHELRHIYEQQKNGGISFSNFKDNTLYMAAADMYNKSAEGTAKKNVGLLGYLSFDYERHSFVEEYFDGIKQLITKIQAGEENPDKLVHYLDNDNKIMKMIATMRFTLSKLENNDKKYVSAANEMLENTGFSFEKFTQMAEDAIKDLSLRYGRCIVKAKNDYPDIFKDRRYADLSYRQNIDRPHPEYYI